MIARILLLTAFGCALVFSSGNLRADEPYWEQWDKAQKAGVCHLHHEKMKAKTVPIAYGLPAFNDYLVEFMKAEQATFPHAKDVLMGGCVVMEEKEAKVFECPTCRKVKKQWLAEHPAPAKKGG